MKKAYHSKTIKQYTHSSIYSEAKISVKLNVFYIFI